MLVAATAGPKTTRTRAAAQIHGFDIENLLGSITPRQRDQSKTEPDYALAYGDVMRTKCQYTL